MLLVLTLTREAPVTADQFRALVQDDLVHPGADGEPAIDLTAPDGTSQPYKLVIDPAARLYWETLHGIAIRFAESLPDRDPDWPAHACAELGDHAANVIAGPDDVALFRATLGHSIEDGTPPEMLRDARLAVTYDLLALVEARTGRILPKPHHKRR